LSPTSTLGLEKPRYLELYNTLSLVKPSFPNMLPHELKKFYQEHKKASKEFSWELDFGNSKTGNPSDDNIQQLKLLIDPKLGTRFWQ
jgi:DNA repair and recombination RAD54-like protein